MSYCLLSERRNARVWVLIIASLGFYGYWDLRFLPQLVGSASAYWLLAKAYQNRRFGDLVPIGVGLNLTLIGLFKYANFLVDLGRD